MKAQQLYESGWWVGRSARDLARIQLFTRELCLPFEIFHRAVEEALGRPVLIHEFGFNVDGLILELYDESDPPTLEQLLSLVPVKRCAGVWIEDNARELF